MAPKAYYLGMDVGGTATKLAIKKPGIHEPIKLQGPGTNLQRDGLEHTAAILHALIEEAGVLTPPSSPTFLCIGVAGAGRDVDQAHLQERLSARTGIPQHTLQVHSDAHIAHIAAHRDKSGILMIVGTGSMILARTKQGTFVRAGGWGYLLGDEAGGFQLGLATLKAVAAAMDGGPSTRLTADLCQQERICTPQEIIANAYEQRENIPRLAPLLLAAAEKEDTVAQSIVAREIQQLIDRLSWLLDNHLAIDSSTAIMGGLMNNPFYRNALQQALRSLPGLTFIEPEVTPCEAALTLARRMK